MSVINTGSFGQFWPVSWTTTLFWGLGVISMIDEPRGAVTCRSSTLTYSAESCPFRSLLLSVLGPRAISPIDEPRVRLCVCRQHSQFCPILTSFVDYYSPFWGPKAISIVVELQGVLTCWSSTLAVSADSGPFHGLLLIVLGSQSDFHGCRIPRCAYMSVINNHSLGRFWPVS